MADLAIMCWFQSGELNFDSSAVDTLFFVSNAIITPGSGFTEQIFTFPAYTNMRLIPNLASPYQVGDVEGYTILSCAITYPGGVPTVRVYVEWPTASSGLPVADGLLTIFYSGRGT